MIHNLTDLESLLHQYDHEKVLVGPLLNLWTNSSFRVFNIAGKSSKIHETIGLGFFEVETDAQRRRADIVAALEGSFGEVEIFDSQLEMAQMAHTLWANDETARFLTTVSLESKPQAIRETSQNQVVESGSNLESVGNLPAAVAGGSVSKEYRFWVLSAAYFVLCFVVGFLIGTAITSFTGVRQAANEATISRDAAASITTDNDPSRVTGTVTDPIPAGPVGSANREGQPREAVRVASPSLVTPQPAAADGKADTASFPEAQPAQNWSDQAKAVPDEQSSQSPTAQGNQSDGSALVLQSSPPQTLKTQSPAAETVPASIPQPAEVVPTQIFASPATQIIASHDEQQSLPSDAATPKAPEALSTAPQQQASNSAIVPLPRPRPVASAVSSDHLRRRSGPLGERARTPLLSLFGH